MKPFLARVLAALALAAPLQAQQPAPARPPLKHIELNGNGSVWLALGGQVRVRGEGWRNFGFGAPADPNDAFVLGRLLASADLHAGRHLRLFVQGKGAALTDRNLPGGRRTSDADDADLQQGYVEFSLEGKARPLAARVGRQELLFGRQRLVSPLDWSNTLRSFEGVRLTLSDTRWTLDGFFTHPVRILKSDFNRWDGDVDLYGLYVQKKPGVIPALDLYWFGFRRAAATVNGTTGRENRHTLGARLFGNRAGGHVEYDLEAAYQLGTLGAGNIAAGMFAADLAYLPKGVPGAPRFHAGLDYAGGDAAPGGNVGTFNQLFPLGHAFLGFIDVVGRQNVVAPNAGVALKPAPTLTIDGTVSRFTRASAGDALYNASGSVERAPGTAVSRAVGTELDLLATYRAGPHVSITTGYSRCWPGGFIRQTGAARPIEFAYGSVTLSY